MVPWLEQHAVTAKGPGSFPGWGTKISQAAWHSQKKKKAVNSLKLCIKFCMCAFFSDERLASFCQIIK